MLLQHTLIGVLAVQLAAAAVAAPPLPQAAVFLPPVPPRDWQTIVLHHSATEGGNIDSIDAVHRQHKDSAGNPWLGIGYHFVVGNGHATAGQGMGDGEVQPTFRWQQQLAGAHAGRREQNEQGIGICLIGNFERAAPTDKQLASLTALLKTLIARYDIAPARVLRHQDVHATLCPGRLFPWERVVEELARDKGS